jgi:hypothetical protein
MKTEPLNEFDQRDAALAQKTEELTALAVERRRLKDAAQAATGARERAHAALGGTITDPMKFATTPDAELQAMRLTLVSSAKAEAQAAAAFAAHEETHGDLAVRGKEIASLIDHLDREKVVQAAQAVAVEKVRKALEVVALELKEHQLLSDAYARWPDGAGLVPCTFPAGVFTASETNLGPNAPRSIFQDDVLRTFAVAYPGVLAQVVPAEEAAAILAGIESVRVKGVIRFAGRKTDWQTSGGWHSGGISAEELKNFLRGPLRREHHGL